MIVLAFVHGALLAAVPSAPLIAVGLWWNSNTISHYFVHRPFFRSRTANVAFGLYLSVLLGVPQAWWRVRHLAHHGHTRSHRLHRGELALQIALIAVCWALLTVTAPVFFVTVYVPGYVTGLLLCALHGHYEHARGTISHYGAIYNFLCFNDGYHIEHHRHPGASWNRLPALRTAGAQSSAWPAPLRWLERCNLNALEVLVSRSETLQRFVISVHARAFAEVAGSLARAHRVAIVGGGLFPRTALVLRRLFPLAELTIIDANHRHLEQARSWLASSRIRFEHARFDGSGDDRFDAIVIPLAYDGDRAVLYTHPPARVVVVHDWIWRKRGVSHIVSPFLLKRLNVVAR